jgi:hypothetical protein
MSDCPLAAMLRAYRDQCQPERVETLTRNGLRQFPADPLRPVVLGLVLADAGRGDEAPAIPAGPPAARRSWSVCLHRVTPHVERTCRSTQFAIILTQPAEIRQNAEARTARSCPTHSESHGERPHSLRR